MLTELYRMFKNEAAVTMTGLHDRTAASEQTYETEVRQALGSSPALFAGKAEKLARMNATATFNAELRSFVGARFNQDTTPSESR